MAYSYILVSGVMSSVPSLTHYQPRDVRLQCINPSVNIILGGFLHLSKNVHLVTQRQRRVKLRRDNSQLCRQQCGGSGGLYLCCDCRLQLRFLVDIIFCLPPASPLSSRVNNFSFSDHRRETLFQ